MNSFLKQELSKTIDIKDLKRVLPSYCRIAYYDKLKNVKTLKEAMRGSSVLILLWNIHDEKKRVLNEPGHFYLISTRGPERCVVFSSTGMAPRKELFETQSDPGLLDRILPNGTIYNNKHFQKTRDSATCWRWCLLYAHLAHLGLKKFQTIFWNRKLLITDPDLLSVAFTYILFN